MRFAIFTVLALCLSAFGCAPDMSISPLPTEEQNEAPALAKPVTGARNASEAAIVSIKLTDTEATHIEGALVFIKRSLAGVVTPVLDSCTTNGLGAAKLYIETEGNRATGYYVVTAEKNGEVVGVWGSIPINGGGHVQLYLTPGRSATIETKFEKLDQVAFFAVLTTGVQRSFGGYWSKIVESQFGVTFNFHAAERRGTINANSYARNDVLTVRSSKMNISREYSGKKFGSSLTDGDPPIYITDMPGTIISVTSEFYQKTVIFRCNPDGSVAVIDDGL